MVDETSSLHQVRIFNCGTIRYDSGSVSKIQTISPATPCHTIFSPPGNYFNLTKMAYNSEGLYIANECGDSRVPLSFMIENHCLHYDGIWTIANGFFRQYEETEESISKRGGNKDSQATLNPNWDGKFTMTVYDGDREIRCDSVDTIDEIGQASMEALESMTSSDWETCRYVDNDEVAKVDTTISCGCYQDESLSKGDIAGIAVGSVIGVVLLGLTLFGIYKFCKKKRVTESANAGDHVSPV